MNLSRILLVTFVAAGVGLSGCATRRPATVSAGAPSGADLSAAAPQSPSSFGAPGAGSGTDGAVSPAAQAELIRDFSERVGDRVYFAFDSHELSAEARATLRAQASWLSQRPQLRVLVAGHADERGTREYNLALGSRRAQAASAFLVAEGVAAGRIDTVSYGKERPLDPRSNEEGWARNRNAHTVLVDLVGPGF